MPVPMGDRDVHCANYQSRRIGTGADFWRSRLWIPPKLGEQHSNPFAQWSEIGLEDAPHASIVDLLVGMNEHVAKGHHVGQFRDASSEAWIDLRELAQCFTDDRELALYRRAEHQIAGIFIKVPTPHETRDGVG